MVFEDLIFPGEQPREKCREFPPNPIVNLSVCQLALSVRAEPQGFDKIDIPTFRPSCSKDKQNESIDKLTN